MEHIDHIICFKDKFYRKQFKSQGNCGHCSIVPDSKDCKFLSDYCNGSSYLKEVKLDVNNWVLTVPVV